MLNNYFSTIEKGIKQGEGLAIYKNERIYEGYWFDNTSLSWIIIKEELKSLLIQNIWLIHDCTLYKYIIKENSKRVSEMAIVVIIDNKIR